MQMPNMKKSKCQNAGLSMNRKDIFETKISWFRNYNTPVPAGEVEIRKILESTTHKPLIDQIRSITDKNKRTELKAKLPAFTPSCTCSRRNQGDVLAHSGLIQFDIDAKDNGGISMTELRKRISMSANIAYCGLSVSGTGLWGLIPIAYPELHKAHFEYIRRYFDMAGIVIDTAPSSVVSLRGLSYDENAYLNPLAEPLTRYYIEPPREPFRYKGGTFMGDLDSQLEDVDPVLLKHGWVIAGRRGDKTYYTRPGKDRGNSAEYDSGIGVFFVYTSSAEGFEAWKGYTPFQVYARLECGGDYKQAARELRRRTG